MKPLIESLIPIPVAALGAWLGFLTGLPLGELIGAICAVTALSKWGVRMRMPFPFVATVQLLLGISVGSTVTASMMHELTDVSILLGLLVCMTTQILVGYNWLRRMEKWGHIESLLSAIPGAMAAVMTVSGEEGPASGRIAFVHIVRLLALLLVVTLIAGGHGDSAAHAAGTLGDYLRIVPVAVVAVVAGYLLERLDVPAPYMLTGLVCAAAVNIGMPQFNLHVPDPVAMVALILLGGLIGIRLRDITLGDVLRYVRAGLVVTTLTFCTTLLVAALAAQITGKPFLALFMSWVPGGVEVMTAAALLLKLDPAFVMLNHVVRMSIIHISPAFLPKRLLQPEPAADAPRN
ncbi:MULTISPECIES: AbrB family transcriptional regulator [unclassified Pseudomonas]|uniref:AbrB family transcriptional regulator n=1 Tax=unclassified Pseudomonas TaxID=196821 RepID=UPI0019419D79|nr:MULTISPECIES: AbrB family transcriptional regulator [unclassified Pseudomonas]MDC0689035.1 AbrB family transcriptional regulator [Mitsuaria sp. RG]MCE0917936.1 AbrB family transcriptional regulator [Pseudomonas sp. NMI760_13]MCF1490358.1 AbrB family transcriptional regulator [Pseudomonas sp. AA27]MCP8635802.1 AbrB family transcriptional regulator [Pseudomonas sp. DVZ6]MDD7786291.1 AbrB family transcriptional regulator [Pseudomonas sp. DVZ24]